MPPLLDMRAITKSFPGVRAVRGVDITLHAGEVLALMGENGAGKSTLLKILGGAQTPDAGTIAVDGRPIAIRSPVEARRAGIAVIYQEFNLLPALTVAENIFLGRETTTAGWIRRGEEGRTARQLLQRVGAAFAPETRVRRLSVAEQQAVEIAKALSENSRILVMDEPTAALAPQEVARLHAIIGELKRQGIGIVYVSHRLEEIFAIADRVTVLRDGEHVATRAVGEFTRTSLIEAMVGRKLENEYPARQVSIGEERLVVRNLRRGERVRDVSFSARRGEIVAFTGLVGSGRTETARLLFGADQLERGSITLDGRELRLRSPRDAIRAGICLLSEDRKQQGLVLGLSVLHNFGLPNLRRLSRGGLIRAAGERGEFARFTEQLRIKIPHPGQLAKNLSGGNQQKVVLAKWLAGNSEVLLFDEPTRGIDVGAKFEIYQLMNDLAARGKVILMISSELPEVLGMADRVLVMHEGRITGEIADARRATQQQIMDLAVR